MAQEETFRLYPPLERMMRSHARALRHVCPNDSVQELLARYFERQWRLWHMRGSMPILNGVIQEPADIACGPVRPGFTQLFNILVQDDLMLQIQRINRLPWPTRYGYPRSSFYPIEY